MKKAILFSIILIVTLLVFTNSFAEIIKEQTIHAKKITIVLKEKVRLPIVVDDKIIFSEMGNHPIRDLKSIDFFVDTQGRLQGIRIIYYDRVSGAKSIFVPRPKTVIFEQPRRETKNNSVNLRVLTTDEIINIW